MTRREQLSIALHRLYEVLRKQEQYSEEELPLAKLTKPGGNLIHQLCRHPQTLIYLQNPERNSIPWALQPSWKEGYNHPANRYIQWLLLQLQIPAPQMLRNIPPEPLSNAAIPVVFNDPYYAEVHRIATQILQEQECK